MKRWIMYDDILLASDNMKITDKEIDEYLIKHRTREQCLYFDYRIVLFKLCKNDEMIRKYIEMIYLEGFLDGESKMKYKNMFKEYENNKEMIK